MAGIDIVLDTLFNNPNLPIDPVLGFFDDFNRADGPIGVTSGEGRAWSKLNILSGDGSAVVSSNQAAAAGTTGAYAYTVDAGTGNGTLSTTITTVSTDGNTRLLARFQDYDNTLMLTTVTATGRMQLVKKVAAVSTTIGDIAITSAQVNGKVLEIVMSGTSVSVKLDGATVIGPLTVTDLTANTKNGFYFNATQSKTARYDNFRFAV
jgi:hypothetical protein